MMPCLMRLMTHAMLVSRDMNWSRFYAARLSLLRWVNVLLYEWGS